MQSLRSREIRNGIADHVQESHSLARDSSPLFCGFSVLLGRCVETSFDLSHRSPRAAAVALDEHEARNLVFVQACIQCTASTIKQGYRPQRRPKARTRVVRAAQVALQVLVCKPKSRLPSPLSKCCDQTMVTRYYKRHQTIDIRRQQRPPAGPD